MFVEGQRRVMKLFHHADGSQYSGIIAIGNSGVRKQGFAYLQNAVVSRLKGQEMGTLSQNGNGNFRGTLAVMEGTTIGSTKFSQHANHINVLSSAPSPITSKLFSNVMANLQVGGCCGSGLRNGSKVEIEGQACIGECKSSNAGVRIYGNGTLLGWTGLEVANSTSRDGFFRTTRNGDIQLAKRKHLHGDGYGVAEAKLHNIFTTVYAESKMGFSSAITLGDRLELCMSAMVCNLARVVLPLLLQYSCFVNEPSQRQLLCSNEDTKGWPPYICKHDFC